MSEQPAVFGQFRSLVGVVSDPARPPTSGEGVGVLLVNSGLVHRVGPNRLYVNLARRFASLGLVTLRFDLSGVGDSRARRDHLPLEESAIADLREAMDFLEETRGLRRFVLMGICSGAVNSFAAAGRDPRVVGAVLVNPLAYSDMFWSSVEDFQESKQARSYWTGGALNPASWARVLSGRANYGLLLRRLRGLFIRRSRAVAAASEVASDYQLLVQRDVRLLLVYSGRERRAKDPHEMIFEQLPASVTSTGKVRVTTIDQADHLFNSLTNQQKLTDLVQDYLIQNYPVQNYPTRNHPVEAA